MNNTRRRGSGEKAPIVEYALGIILATLALLGLTLEQLRAGAATLALERLAELDQN